MSKVSSHLLKWSSLSSFSDWETSVCRNFLMTATYLASSYRMAPRFIGLNSTNSRVMCWLALLAVALLSSSRAFVI